MPRELPGNLEQLLVLQRTPVPVELVVPHETRWAVEKYADRVDVLAEHETSARLRGWLYQPVRHRVGLILTDGGPAHSDAQAARLIGDRLGH